ncbi:MAG: ribosome biogenesis GTP-binding protein YihA/YsxC [Oscillospiraceae bacterium]|jgi:GTP-binding protein
MNLQKAEFVLSAVSHEDFPKDCLPQVVFAGRSNVGKSSVINRLLERKNFARVGSAPGKTVHINFFLIDGQMYFVDLPGYGYARVSRAERDRWAKLIESYFASPGLITLGVLIVDARHKPTADDCVMADWFMRTGMNFVVVANKADKVKKSELTNNLSLIAQTLEIPIEVPLFPFSAEKGSGREDLLFHIMRKLG